MMVDSVAPTLSWSVVGADEEVILDMEVDGGGDGFGHLTIRCLR